MADYAKGSPGHTLANVLIPGTAPEPPQRIVVVALTVLVIHKWLDWITGWFPCAPPSLQFVKCGYAGSNFPAHIFPSMVGRPIIRAVNKVGDFEVKVWTFGGLMWFLGFFQFQDRERTIYSNLYFLSLSLLSNFTGFTRRCKWVDARWVVINQIVL